ncbi:MAG: choice-of-anchor D domain-containing protein [Polyangiaceae bacterium]|nr:choice-of-anchor D domain-containing protein [Polyangiaceae bacterium]
MRVILSTSLVLVLSAPAVAFAEEVATPCDPDALTCQSGPVAFSKEIELPIAFGFDTGWVPNGSPLQVHLFANLYANSFVNLAGELETKWPESLTLEAVPKPGAGALGIHYGVDVGAEAHVEVEVLGQTYQWTGPIPYVPQIDFQVENETAFDPWAFDGVTVGGSTMQATLIQVDVTSFIGIDIPGLSGGFELDVAMDLDATYRTDQIRVFEPDGMIVAGGAITANQPLTSSIFLGGPSADFDVQPVGTVVYDGTLHLIPAFFIDTIGPDFSIPIADIPIPFSIEQKDWQFDKASVHVPLPDIALPSDDEVPMGGGEFPTPVTEVLDFGDVWVGTSKPLAIEIHNFGEAKLVSDVTASDAALVTATNELTVAPGAKASVVVNFEPTVAGQLVGTITFASNDPDEPSRTVEVHGNAVEQAVEGEEPPAVDEPDEDDGCNCEAAGSPSSSGSAAWLLAGLALVLGRRRRKQS